MSSDYHTRMILLIFFLFCPLWPCASTVLLRDSSSLFVTGKSQRLPRSTVYKEDKRKRKRGKGESPIIQSHAKTNIKFWMARIIVDSWLMWYWRYVFYRSFQQHQLLHAAKLHSSQHSGHQKEPKTKIPSVSKDIRARERTRRRSLINPYLLKNTVVFKLPSRHNYYTKYHSQRNLSTHKLEQQ